MKTTPAQTALINSLNNEWILRQDIQNYLFNTLNGKDCELKQQIKDTFNSEHFEGFTLGDAQNRKAYEWLLNQWKNPAGAERKNNPFGYREQDAIENFSHCTLKGYYDAGNYYHSFYIPIYDVYTKDGYGFEYYVSNGKIHITG